MKIAVLRSKTVKDNKLKTNGENTVCKNAFYMIKDYLFFEYGSCSFCLDANRRFIDSLIYNNRVEVKRTKKSRLYFFNGQIKSYFLKEINSLCSNANVSAAFMRTKTK